MYQFDGANLGQLPRIPRGRNSCQVVIAADRIQNSSVLDMKAPSEYSGGPVAFKTLKIKAYRVNLIYLLIGIGLTNLPKQFENQSSNAPAAMISKVENNSILR